jgi:hypothetical protein
MLGMTILLMSMRIRNKMGNTHLLKNGVKFLVLASPIGFHGKNFLVKKSLDMILKVTKFPKHIRFLFQEIHPCELAVIINKTHIVFKMTKILKMDPIHHKTQAKGEVDTLVDVGYVS